MRVTCPRQSDWITDPDGRRLAEVVYIDTDGFFWVEDAMDPPLLPLRRLSPAEIAKDWVTVAQFREIQRDRVA